MKKYFMLVIGSLLFLLPAVSSAQVMVGPGPVMGGGSGLPGMFQPRRVGFIHEGSISVSRMTGEVSSDYVAGGGVYYSGLFRVRPSFAWGVHLGVSSSPNIDGDGDIRHGMGGLEGRFYIPLGILDLWVSGVVGIGNLTETATDPEGYEVSESQTGLVVGFGAGANYFITPQLSVGGFVRLYRQMFNDDDTIDVMNVDGTIDSMTPTDYYGLWLVVGGSVALHY